MSKIVMVPSMEIPSAALSTITIDGMVYNVNSTIRTQKNIMDEYIKWYSDGFAPSLYLTTSQISNKFWSRKEISYYIDDNCKDVVLIQHMPSDGWNMIFTNTDDMQLFNSWFNSSRKRWQLVIESHRPEIIELTNEINNYLKDNATDAYIVNYRYESIDVFCKNKDDALSIKLKYNAVNVD